MGAELVVGVFPFLEGAVEWSQLEGALVELVELLGVCPLGSFDGAVELRATRWEDEESDTSVLTGIFEDGGELAAPIDLEGSDGERHPSLHLIEEGGSGRGGSSTMGLEDVPTGDNIACGEVLERDAWKGSDIQRIQFDQITGHAGLILLGFPDGVGA